MADPVEPVLASALWETEASVEHPMSPINLQTKLHAIDQALGDMLQYGAMCGISAQPGSGQSEICHAVLVSHLLSAENATATVLDVGASFDVRGVYQAIQRRIPNEDDVSQVALKILDRLKIIKIFDFDGLTNAVSEVRQSLRSGPREIAQSAPRATIPDSDDEDEMLDDPLWIPTRYRNAKDEHAASTQSHIPGLLLLDNISDLVMPLVKNNHARGQTLLMSFMRSLQHLTRNFNVCTIVVGGTSSHSNGKEASPSAFSSCTFRPLLGKAFTHLLDSHVLIHQTPLHDPKERRPDIKAASVLEVLQYRYQDRVGRWAPFFVDGNGQLQAFSCSSRPEDCDHASQFKLAEGEPRRRIMQTRKNTEVVQADQASR